MKTRKKEAEPEPNGKRRVRGELLTLYRACLNNAEALADEAELLLNHRCHARAFALAYTSFEEIGKSQIVVDLFDDSVSEDEFESAFRDHRLKAAYMRRVVELSVDGFPTASIVYGKQGEHGFSLRNAALYIGKHSDTSPANPPETISPEFAEQAISIVRKELERICTAECITERIGTKSFTK